MATKKKLLQAAAGNAGGEALNVEDVFSTYLYNGTATNVAHRIQNGIDLAGKGGLVWIKKRDSNIANTNHYLSDTERGNFYIASNSTNAQAAGDIASYNSDGWTFNASTGLGTDYLAAQSYASWTFRKAPKFFDIVGNITMPSSGSVVVNHNLGSKPGMILLKSTDISNQWYVWHRSVFPSYGKYLVLNSTSAVQSSTDVFKQVTETSFSTRTNSAGNYIAYVFAHHDSGDADYGSGDFGPDGDADIIKCGSYTGTGSANGPEIDLGFEPQWVMVKRADAGSEHWAIIDNMREMISKVSNNARMLKPNNSEAEEAVGFANPLATGFKVSRDEGVTNASGGTYIYMAIRRGTKVPESATEVFATNDVDNGASAPDSLSGFPVDMYFRRYVNTTNDTYLLSRLTGTGALKTNGTNAEASFSTSSAGFDYNNGVMNIFSSNNADFHTWMWRRAPNFFDVVAYTGEGTTDGSHQINHNLGVAPEMIIYKDRNLGASWLVWHTGLGQDGSNRYYSAILNSNGAKGLYSVASNDILVNPQGTSTYFPVGGSNTNPSGYNYIAYLFATLAGISKVGSYTGNGTSQTIDCGFTSGARFVLLKRTDSVGDWMLYDSTRGITSTSNDPALALNNTDAEFTENSFFGADVIRPHSSGFIIDNYFSSSSHNYIFYAIA